MRRPAGSTSRTTTSTSAPTGNALPNVRFLGDAGLAHRDETRAPRGQEHEHAELLVTLDLSREARARHDRRLRRRRPGRARRALRNERDADPLLLEVDAQDLECPRHPRATEADHPPDRPVGANVDACASASTPGSSSTNAPNSATRVTRPVRTWPTSYVSGNARPRIGGELLQPEGDLLLVVVDAQDLDRDLLAGLDDLRRVRHAGPPHLGHVQQALHAATEVDERAELAHRGDAPGHHRAGDDRSPDLGGAWPAAPPRASARRETTRFLPPSLYSMIRNS